MHLKNALENLSPKQMGDRRVRQLVPRCSIVQDSDGSSSSSSSSSSNNKINHKKCSPNPHSRQNTDNSRRSCSLLPTANNHQFQIFLL
jgi:hypothetical protein